ncbi:hypothetical protein Pcinc_029681 [Petrolisthes cinctipes]|uniref:Uncharacterized protein n=1 Tax=Petrolisthes cinctipes TaxID=88211 RepID=A0AAE1EZK4_PETCI|nr:hypothetical protein Pcinc_029681 [Petrolisthes cinctipes]
MSGGIGGGVDDTGVHVVVAGGRRGNRHLARPFHHEAGLCPCLILGTSNNTLNVTIPRPHTPRRAKRIPQDHTQPSLSPVRTVTRPVSTSSVTLPLPVTRSNP